MIPENAVFTLIYWSLCNRKMLQGLARAIRPESAQDLSQVRSSGTMKDRDSTPSSYVSEEFCGNVFRDATHVPYSLIAMEASGKPRIHQYEH